MNSSYLIDIFLFTILTYSLHTDLKYGKIYNFITIPSIAAGLSLNALISTDGALAGIYNGSAAVLIAFVFFIIPYMIGALGGGDVKLMMAIGALKGYYFLAISILSIGLVSFALSLFVFMMQMFKDYKFSGMMNIIAGFYHKNILVDGDELKPILKKNLKFGISIFFGTIIAYVYLLNK